MVAAWWALDIGFARIRVGFNFILINSAFTLVLMKFMYVEWIVSV